MAFSKKSKGSPYSIAELRVPELIPVFGSQPAGDVSHKPGGRLPLLCRIFKVDRTTAVDNQSEISFSIPQGTLPWQPIFVGLSTELSGYPQN